MHVGDVGVHNPDEEFHHRIIIIYLSTSNEGIDVLAIWNNSLLVYADFIVAEFTSEVTESNRTETNLEEIVPHSTFLEELLDLFAMENVFVIAEFCIWIRDDYVCNLFLLGRISVDLKFYNNTKKNMYNWLKDFDWNRKIFCDGLRRELMCIYMSWDVEHYDWFNIMN